VKDADAKRGTNWPGSDDLSSSVQSEDANPDDAGNSPPTAADAASASNDSFSLDNTRQLGAARPISGVGGGFSGATNQSADGEEGAFDEEAAGALMEMLGDDGSGALPLPLKSRFSRIPAQVASRSSSDPFERLYLGAFGPHGPEVLRLVRGRWGDELGEGAECVTAVKLTGDANVPAGAASFRAKVGPGHKLDSSFSYPEELGVVSRYKGQGRVAKPGFSERNWVDGELLLLDGRGGSLTGGAELGFVWAVPGERRLLILFSSLQLPDAVPPVGMYID
jgi:hypothetical protein